MTKALYLGPAHVYASAMSSAAQYVERLLNENVSQDEASARIEDEMTAAQLMVSDGDIDEADIFAQVYVNALYDAKPRL